MTGALAIQPLTRPIDDVTVPLPGSKSITNRALVCAALASGRSVLRRVLQADDTWAMVGALRALGVSVDVDATTMTIDGGVQAPTDVVVDARQSGTTARFVAPLLALGGTPVVLDGAAQMRGRPMGPLVDALRALGATVDTDALPMTVNGPLRGGEVELAGDVSSQFLSGLMLAAPCLDEALVIRLTTPLVSRPYAAMTAAVMRAFGAEVVVGEGEVRVEPGGYRATDYEVEPDASAASNFFAAAAVCGGTVRVDGLGTESLQGDLGFVDLLAAMGAQVERTPTSTAVTGGGELRGIDVDLADLSDTAPTLAVVGSFAATPTRVRGIGFIRRKESDRVGGLVDELTKLGATAEEEEDGFVVHPSASSLHGGVVDTYDDHRMAMAFAVLGLRVAGVSINDPGCVAKTFPAYFDVLELLRK